MWSDRSSWLAHNDLAFAIHDAFPVSPGHTLVVTKRDVASWRDTTAAEKAAVMALIDDVVRALTTELNPDGFNIGINDGAAAGQTVPHVHVHVIPRYNGDTPDPRGGVRRVIPGAGNYLEGTPELRDAPLRPLGPALGDALADERIVASDLVVSFVMDSGVDVLEPHIEALLDRGGRVRFLTTDYLGITERRALERLLARSSEYGDRLSVRVHRSGPVSFHPKAYLLRSADFPLGSQGFVGSANVSRSGLVDGHEWTVRTSNADVLAAMARSFDRLWEDDRSVPLTPELIQAYAEASRTPGVEVVAVAAPAQPVAPTPAQREALAELEKTRAEGYGAGLVVMATGLGKTWLAAFDSSRPRFRRLLVLAHREEILNQTREVVRRVRPDATVGYVMGDRDERNADVVLATVQTLSRRLSDIAPTAYDYVVVDEFHHAAAASYRRVLAHLEPAFLLGLTATPDRADGADLLSLCDDNLVYECGLAEGLKRQLLTPFRYHGVPDPVDFTPLPWRNQRFDPAALETAVVTEERSAAALREWQRLRGTRTLAFCVSQRHADWMTAYVRERGIRAAAVHAGATSAPRFDTLASLAAGELDVVFSVDMYNEGVDVPEVDTILLLRPTASPVLFLQQIGRGLRLAEGKSHVTVIDFVGNHRSFLLPARILLGMDSGSLASDAALREALESGSFALPAGCSADYELAVRESLLTLLPRARGRALEAFLRQWVDEHGRRPTAAQALRAGFNPASAPVPWFAYLLDLGLLDEEERAIAEAHAAVLDDATRTSMTKSYKMVALRALASAEDLATLSRGMSTRDNAEVSRRLILRDPRLVDDVRSKEIADVASVSVERWTAYWTAWPLAHLAGRGGFRLDGDTFGLVRPPSPRDARALADMLAEIADWRLAAYLDRRPDAVASSVRVIRNSSGGPILMLDRQRNPGLPTGRDTPVIAGGRHVEFDFVKVAVNVAHDHGSRTNVLPDILFEWFGPQAGASGTSHRVRIWLDGQAWRAEPVQVHGSAGQGARDAGRS